MSTNHSQKHRKCLLSKLGRSRFYDDFKISCSKHQIISILCVTLRWNISSSILHHRLDETLIHPTKALGYTWQALVLRCADVSSFYEHDNKLYHSCKDFFPHLLYNPTWNTCHSCASYQKYF